MSSEVDSPHPLLVAADERAASVAKGAVVAAAADDDDQHDQQREADEEPEPDVVHRGLDHLLSALVAILPSGTGWVS